MAQSGRRRVEEYFNEERMASEMQALYGALLERKGYGAREGFRGQACTSSLSPKSPKNEILGRGRELAAGGR
jgi:hypothetical protein